MTDELSLLKSAAIAIGGEYIPAHEGYCLSLGGVTRVWNPIMDSGDALELAVRLKLSIHISGSRFHVGRTPWPPIDICREGGIDGVRYEIVAEAAALVAAMEGKSHE